MPPATIDEDYTPGAKVVGDDGLLYHASGTSFAAPYVAGVGSLTGYGALNVGAALEATPEFFIEASIAGVTLAPNGESVTMVGTAEAHRFAGAVIEPGRGEAPTQWQTVGQL